MKKTALFLLSAAFVLAFGTIAVAQEREDGQPAADKKLPGANGIQQEAVARTAPPTRIDPAEEPGQSPAQTKTEAARRADQEAAAKSVPATKTELIQLKYANVSKIYSLLQAYRSSFGRIIIGGTDKTLAITDTPDIIEKMIQVVRDIDVKPTELQFTVQIIQGFEGAVQPQETPFDDPIIRELRSVLKYKNYSLLDGTILRVIDGEKAEAKVGPNGEYSIEIAPTFVKDGAMETIQAQIDFRKPQWIPQSPSTEKGTERSSMLMYNNPLVKTTLTLKSGEKTVVGVSKSDADRGLILILSGKTIK